VRESRELIWSLDLIRAQLSSLLGRLRPGATPPLFGPLPAGAGEWRAAVRLAYRQVLQHAIEHGQPRRPGQTPSGYLPALLAIWPEEAEALRRLTDLYTTARYDPTAPSAEQAAQARASLARIIGRPAVPVNRAAKRRKESYGPQSSPADGA
jgi:hypothetical protein